MGQIPQKVLDLTEKSCWSHIEKNNLGLVISERFFQVIEVGYANTS